MATKLGILVGHYGYGTGAKWHSRDEWTLCYEDAHALAALCEDTDIEPVVISLDYNVHPWRLFKSELRKRGLRNVDVRADWAIAAGCHIAVELHLNSAVNTSATGHEVWVRGPYSKMLGEAIYAKMAEALGNRPRGIKTRRVPTLPERGFRILRRLQKADIPCCILEPVFIWENNFVSLERRRKYLMAVRDGILEFINGG